MSAHHFQLGQQVELVGAAFDLGFDIWVVTHADLLQVERVRIALDALVRGLADFSPSQSGLSARNLVAGLTEAGRCGTGRSSRRLARLPGDVARRKGNLSQPIAIAARIRLDKTTLTYLIDGLEKEALVTRSPDPQDRRSRHINLTAKGQKTLARLTTAVEAVEQQVLSRLSASDAAGFQQMLVTAAGLEERPSDAPADDEEELHICKVTLGADEAL